MNQQEQFRLKVGLAEMLKGGVIMDVMTADQARIAEEAGACAVMALERIPARIRREGGVARMSDPRLIKEIEAAVSTGSACSAASPGPSHVLTAMGLPPADAHASMRFSLGDGNDEADIDRILEATAGAVSRLRALDAPGAAPPAPVRRSA